MAKSQQAASDGDSSRQSVRVGVGVWGLKERARGPGHGTPRSRQGGACESGGKAELEAQSSPAEGSGDVL